MFRSTKILELGSCAFRQPHASHSHCRFIHGYKLSGKFWFEAKDLDINNWVVDFGGLKGLKVILKHQFDHTTCIASDDPALPIFQQLVNADACDLRIMPKGTGVERISEWCFNEANKYIAEYTNNRCACIKVEIFEHEDNSAIYKSREYIQEDSQSELKFPEAYDTVHPSTSLPPAPLAPVKKVVESGTSISSNDNKQINSWINPNADKNSWAF